MVRTRSGNDTVTTRMCGLISAMVRSTAVIRDEVPAHRQPSGTGNPVAEYDDGLESERGRADRFRSRVEFRGERLSEPCHHRCRRKDAARRTACLAVVAVAAAINVAGADAAGADVFLPGEAFATADSFSIGIAAGGGKSIDVVVGRTIAMYQEQNAKSSAAVLDLGLLATLLGPQSACDGKPPILGPTQLPRSPPRTRTVRKRWPSPRSRCDRRRRARPSGR